MLATQARTLIRTASPGPCRVGANPMTTVTVATVYHPLSDSGQAEPECHDSGGRSGPGPGPGRLCGLTSGTGTRNGNC